MTPARPVASGAGPLRRSGRSEERPLHGRRRPGSPASPADRTSEEPPSAGPADDEEPRSLYMRLRPGRSERFTGS